MTRTAIAGHLTMWLASLMCLTSGLAGLFKARAVAGVDAAHFRLRGPAGSGDHPAGAYFPSTRQFIELLFGKRGAFAYLADLAGPVDVAADGLRVDP